ncbi:alpha-L-fucosidase 2 [Runella defluvii]|uniref:Alpha-L-fucosidase 2 n=1 Tax=Runella defluvii TaxID=370973 RepID=A0A7W6ESD5_9BACT|nr:glycoside hydrolase family 95 protein [Runella defluvii]MBB3840523.1 alpha-L-fucosidase 2 [Runella defluvii]
MKKLLFHILLLPFWGYAQDYQLWYNTPAEKWTEALPIGNGRVGAMVFGGVKKDRIQFNEETLWTGEPRNPNRQDAAKYLAEIRQLLAEGKQKAAEQLAEIHFMGLKTQEGKKEQWTADMLALKGLVGNPALMDFDDARWETMPVPSYEGWEAIGFEGLDGAVWFRTTVDVPANWQGKSIVLDLNRVRDYDLTYVNGQLIGTTNSLDPRKYRIPANLLKPGSNVIAIQVINFFDKGGIAGYKDTSRPIGLYPEDEPTALISLVKPWKYKIQDENPPATPKYQADYQPFGDLTLTLSDLGEISDYRRELRLSDALCKTSFRTNGTHFTRTYFVSEPQQVMVVRLEADRKASLSLTAALSSPHKGYLLRRLDKHTLALSVKVKNGALKGESYLTVQLQNGTLKCTDQGIEIEKADNVTFYLTAATNYVNYQDISANPVALCQQTMTKIGKKTYEEILTAHSKEYQSYYQTFSIDLGKSAAENLPTQQRLAQFGQTPDPALMALYVQYGRYLLISSSRPKTRPANLQGIWNDLLAPPWGSKYTTNINAEMNYWGAEVLNLSPLHEPLLEMIKELSVAGQETARTYYNARGWVVHHNTDIWRNTTPINASNHGIWVTGAAWLCQHLWEHYLFTQDREFLQKTAYPMMKEASAFFVDFLVKDPKTGWLISTPSNSPENGGLVAGPTMDHQIIRGLLKSCIAASEVLKTDDAWRKTLQTTYAQIAPNQIGKYGQLQEWLEDKDDTTNKHRHVSHLWGLHPGNEINWDETPEVTKAARQSLLYRGDEGTGWSLAWKINFWARFKDGEHAQKMVKMLLRPASGAGGSYANLFDAHPPFQIDGNFGGSAGIVEMLLQSHTKYIDLLPALPQDLPKGNIRGIKARGGFELDVSWKQGKLTYVKITSVAGNPCTLRYAGKVRELVIQKGQTIELKEF